MTATGTRDRADDVVHTARAAASDAADQARAGVASAADALPEMISTIRSGVDGMAERLPDALEAARTGAVATADSLRDMPRPTLRVLAALSIGLGVGLFVAGAPRLVTIAAFTPALLAGFMVGLDEPGTRSKGH